MSFDDRVEIATICFLKVEEQHKLKAFNVHSLYYYLQYFGSHLGSIGNQLLPQALDFWCVGAVGSIVGSHQGRLGEGISQRVAIVWGHVGCQIKETTSTTYLAYTVGSKECCCPLLERKGHHCNYWQHKKVKSSYSAQTSAGKTFLTKPNGLNGNIT